MLIPCQKRTAAGEVCWLKKSVIQGLLAGRLLGRATLDPNVLREMN
jgi:hypothetical protein